MLWRETHQCENDFKYPNCKEIENNGCVLCREGYFPQEGICLKGKLPFCIIYKSINSCKLCVNGYMIWKIGEFDLCVH